MGLPLLGGYTPFLFATQKIYEDIHKSHPNDVECVRYLITICKEMKLKYDHYAVHLRKLEHISKRPVFGLQKGGAPPSL